MARAVRPRHAQACPQGRQPAAGSNTPFAACCAAYACADATHFVHKAHCAPPRRAASPARSACSPCLAAARRQGPVKRARQAQFAPTSGAASFRAGRGVVRPSPLCSGQVLPRRFAQDKEGDPPSPAAALIAPQCSMISGAGAGRASGSRFEAQHRQRGHLGQDRCCSRRQCLPPPRDLSLACSAATAPLRCRGSGEGAREPRAASCCPLKSPAGAPMAAPAPRAAYPADAGRAPGWRLAAPHSSHPSPSSLDDDGSTLAGALRLGAGLQTHHSSSSAPPVCSDES